LEPNIVVGIGKPLVAKLVIFSKNLLLLLIWMSGFPMVENKNVEKLEAQSTMESIERLVCYFVNLGYKK
jgi:hypothetical protein